MRIDSPLSNLREILNQVQSSAANYKPTLIKNEAATRAVLIDPVLRALGWNTANTYMVEVEKTLLQTQIDYALYDNNGVINTIVEAKKMGDNLNQSAMQLVQYAFTFRLANIFLTDGIIWHHYTDFKPNQFAPTEVLNIQQDNLSDVAAYLVRHLDAALFWPEEKDTKAPEILRLQQDYSALEKRILALEGGTAQPILPAQNWVELDKLPDVTNTLPSQMRLPNGSFTDVKSWSHALITACEYALNTDPQFPVPFSDSAKGTINLIDAVRRPTGQSRQIQTKSGNAVFVYVNFSANGCVANINHIFNHIASKQSVKPAVVYASV